MERETRFELATPTLARLCSTPELFPRPNKSSHFSKLFFICQGSLIAKISEFSKISLSFGSDKYIALLFKSGFIMPEPYLL